MLLTISEIDQYTPNKPIPAGPSNSASTFVRTIPMPVFNVIDPPINADDFSTCPYDFVGTPVGVAPSLDIELVWATVDLWINVLMDFGINGIRD
jgi:hypothetical protein